MAQWLVQTLDSSLEREWRRRLPKLRIEQGAIADGHQNLPAPSSEQLSAKEAEIVGLFEHGRNLLLDWFRDRLTQAAGQIRTGLPDSFDAGTWILNCKQVVTTTIAENRQGIENACLDEDKKRRDLNKFRAEHRIERGVQTPSFARVVLSAGILLFCIALESALNMAFFAHGVGLIQGALYAIAVSATNVGMGVIAGLLGLRLATNKKIGKRCIGTVLLVTVLAAAVFANLLYAHAREVSLTTEEGGFNGAAALAHLVDQPGAIGNSIMLLFLGLMVFAIGVLDGRAGFTDPYWNYGKIGHQHRVAQEEVDGLVSYVRDRIQEEMTANEAALEQVVGRAKRGMGFAQLAVEQARTRREEVDASCRRMVALCKQSLAAYRQKTVLLEQLYSLHTSLMRTIQVSLTRCHRLIFYLICCLKPRGHLPKYFQRHNWQGRSWRNFASRSCSCG